MTHLYLTYSTTNVNVIRPLFIYTDIWCSSGQFMADGTLVQTGGDFEGNKKIRTLAPYPSAGNCDWVETNVPLARGRWYSSNQVLPGGTRQIVVVRIEIIGVRVTKPTIPQFHIQNEIFLAKERSLTDAAFYRFVGTFNLKYLTGLNTIWKLLFHQWSSRCRFFQSLCLCIYIILYCLYFLIL